MIITLSNGKQVQILGMDYLASVVNFLYLDAPGQHCAAPIDLTGWPSEEDIRAAIEDVAGEGESEEEPAEPVE